ncbi:hypothetical protein D9757_003217 [Collybiopsis confluens]|uniref:Uncharacterized protein n=1 Tax=Collybiopsis confluens TaxID=2823264 RepID=A0A8H5MFH4_9AGAR|nr:hypothetical protein D9757_003217 [Collybiopsis confluens]
MSGSTNFNSTSLDATRPSHHVHHSNDPLPGAQRGVDAIDYSAETMERTPSTWNDRTEEQFARDQPGMMGSSDRTTMGSDQHEHEHEQTQGMNAFNEPRPMDVEPTPAGGVAVGGRADLPEGKAGMMDKVVGKTQKVMGKAMHKPELHEKGELRESGGKAAAAGGARAPHD